MSRLVTAHLFTSVNGVCESPNEFQFGAFGPEEGEMMGRVIGPVTDMVLGATLFREWSEFWPTMPADDPFARFVNGVRKHVVSSTLTGDLGWNATRIKGGPVEYVRALKEGEGGDISVGGGVETVRTLFLGGVVDRLRLTMHPAVGSGRRLFDESVPVTRLELLEAVPTSAGNVLLTYALRPTD
ncbi:dihydrofolate reductase family protein [Phycicoccus avicenniae]|uniref:dihydrofolate reductase family protein n=1 Tax=Phycicoccus avicenniae TaxID=2828860 RepID=UPI003D2D2EFF